MSKEKGNSELEDRKTPVNQNKEIQPPQDLIEEIGGVDGPEPTRYGDWEKKGRCIDF